MSNATSDPPNFTNTDLLQIVVPSVVVFHGEETMLVYGNYSTIEVLEMFETGENPFIDY